MKRFRNKLQCPGLYNTNNISYTGSLKDTSEYWKENDSEASALKNGLKTDYIRKYVEINQIIK